MINQPRREIADITARQDEVVESLTWRGAEIKHPSLISFSSFCVKNSLAQSRSNRECSWERRRFLRKKATKGRRKRRSEESIRQRDRQNQTIKDEGIARIPTRRVAFQERKERWEEIEESKQV